MCNTGDQMYSFGVQILEFCTKKNLTTDDL